MTDWLVTDTLPGEPYQQLADRIMAKIVITSRGCWHWIGANNGRYGYIKVDGRVRRAHRVTYELFHGRPASDALDLDHLCRNTFCVNPLHLEEVTRSENNRRILMGTGRCRNGHTRTTENTYVRADDQVDCRECRRERERGQR